MQTPLQFLQRESTKLDIVMSKAAGFMPGGYVTSMHANEQRLREIQADKHRQAVQAIANRFRSAVADIGPVNAAQLLFKELGMNPAMVTGNDNEGLYNMLAGENGDKIFKQIQQFAQQHPLETDESSGVTFEKVQLPNGKVIISPVPVNQADGTVLEPISGMMALQRRQAELEGEAMTADQVRSLIDAIKQPGYNPMEYPDGKLTPYEMARGINPDSGANLNPQQLEAMAAANILTSNGVDNLTSEWWQKSSPEQRKQLMGNYFDTVEYNGKTIPWADALKAEQQRLGAAQTQKVPQLTPQQYLNDAHPLYGDLKELNQYLADTYKDQLGPALKDYNSPWSDTFGRNRSKLFDLFVGPRTRVLSQREADQLRGAGAVQNEQLKPTAGSRYNNLVGRHIQDAAEAIRFSKYLPEGLTQWKLPWLDENTWYGNAANKVVDYFNPIGIAADIPSGIVSGVDKVLGAVPRAHGNAVKKFSLDNTSRAYTGTDMGLSSGAIDSQFTQSGDVNNRFTHKFASPFGDLAEGALNLYTWGKGTGALARGASKLSRVLGKPKSAWQNFQQKSFGGKLGTGYRTFMSPYDVYFGGDFVPSISRELFRVHPEGVTNPNVEPDLYQRIRMYVPQGQRVNVFNDPVAPMDQAARRGNLPTTPADTPRYNEMINFSAKHGY